jgi:hypothetical protein
MARTHKVVSGMLLLAMLVFGATVLAQDSPPATEPPPQLLTPDQLDNLVAPIALYPDALLSQVLVASTYPLEVVEASQWLQQNRNLQGQQLAEAARQQNWDPSVQALVIFPDVLGRMASNVAWTTDLGNAFLAQQADVMNAVQRMRAEARAAGRLGSDDRQTVNVVAEDGRTVIEIVPANPEVIYVPVYNPEYIWGPPAWGYYPPLYYPAFGFGFGFGPGIRIGAFFGGWSGWGWGAWGGWGWGPNWFNCTIIQNTFFFNHYGYHRHYAGFGRGGLWAHNPYHRLGVPYPNRGLAVRYGGSYFDGRGGGVRAVSGVGRGGFAGGSRSAGNFRSFGPRGNGSVAGSRGAVSASPNRGAAAGDWRRMGSGSRAPSSGSWQRFGNAGGSGVESRQAQSYRSAPTARSSSLGSFRSNPSYGGGSSVRSTPSFRSAPTYGGSRSAPSFRSAPSYGGGFPGRSVPSVRSAPSFNGGGRSTPSFRSAPSYGGGFSGRSAPSVRSAPSFSGGGRSFSSARQSFGGGGASRSSGGSRGGGFSGGGSRGGGGGSRSSSGGGSRGGRR